MRQTTLFDNEIQEKDYSKWIKTHGYRHRVWCYNYKKFKRSWWHKRWILNRKRRYEMLYTSRNNTKNSNME